MKPNYKMLLTEYLEKRLKSLADVDAYDEDKLVLSKFLFTIGFMKDNDTIVAYLKIKVDSDKKHTKYMSRFKGAITTPSEYVYSANKIAKECLDYLRKEGE